MGEHGRHIPLEKPVSRHDTYSSYLLMRAIATLVADGEREPEVFYNPEEWTAGIFPAIYSALRKLGMEFHPDRLMSESKAVLYRCSVWNYHIVNFKDLVSDIKASHEKDRSRFLVSGDHRNLPYFVFRAFLLGYRASGMPEEDCLALALGKLRIRHSIDSSLSFSRELNAQIDEIEESEAALSRPAPVVPTPVPLPVSTPPATPAPAPAPTPAPAPSEPLKSQVKTKPDPPELQRAARKRKPSPEPERGIYINALAATDPRPVEKKRRVDTPAAGEKRKITFHDLSKRHTKFLKDKARQKFRSFVEKRSFRMLGADVPLEHKTNAAEWDKMFLLPRFAGYPPPAQIKMDFEGLIKKNAGKKLYIDDVQVSDPTCLHLAVNCVIDGMEMDSGFRPKLHEDEYYKDTLKTKDLVEHILSLYSYPPGKPISRNDKLVYTRKASFDLFKFEFKTRKASH